MSERNETVYRGEDFDTAGGGTVIVDPGGRELDTGYDNDDLPSHSPDGFQVGYGGSGPAQLAAALLYDVTGDVDTTNQLYQEFKRDIISDLADEWTMTADFIEGWVDSHV